MALKNRVISALTAGTFAVGLMTASPAGAEEAAPEPMSFVAMSSSTVADIIASAVELSGPDAVAANLEGMAEAGAVLPGLQELDSETASDVLRQMAKSVREGRKLQGRDAQRLVTTGLRAGEGGDTGGVTANSLSPGVEENTVISSGFAWLMRDWLGYYECILWSCTMVDRMDFRYVINPGPKTSRVDITLSQPPGGDDSISSMVTVRAQTLVGTTVKATDEDDFWAPGTATSWPVVPNTTLTGSKIRFRMTTIVTTPGVSSGVGETTSTMTCSSTCRWTY